MASKLNHEELNAARMILQHPLTSEILDDLEKSAIDSAVNAKVADEITPAAYLAEVRAIRSFRSRLQFIVGDGEAALQREKAAEQSAASTKREI